MAILCRLHAAYGDDLINAIRSALPNEDVRAWPDVGNPDDIDICMIFRMSRGFLRPFGHLRLISSTGAGVDHFLLDPDLPRDVPLVRIIDADFAARMADYVLSWVLFHHREVAHFLAAQHQARWSYKPIRSANDVTVGVMGLGQMGRLTCGRLALLGYQVRAWSRTPQVLPDVTGFAGPDALTPFLEGTEILVNLLALTQQTRGILGRATFDRLPHGAVLISPARGGHLVEQDLLDALASGRLRAATIDAFPVEPLPAAHPFWHQSGLFVTPLCSSTASLEMIVAAFAENVRRLRANEPLLNRVDYARGY